MSQNLLQANTLIPKVLASQQMSDTNPHAAYTAPDGGAAVVKHGTVCNIGAAAATVTIAVVPSGATYDGTHRVVSAYSVPAGDTLPLSEYLGNCHLGPGDAIYVQAGTANVIDVVLSGVEAS